MPTRHVRGPAPINQFYRLDRDTPTSPWRKTTRWNHTHPNAKGIVTAWDGLLCMAGEGAVALDAHTGGTTRSTPGSIHDRQGDQLGGIGVDDVAAAFRTYGQTLLIPDKVSRYDLGDLIDERRHCAVAIDYRELPYADRVQKPGLFDHAIGFDDRSGDQLFRNDTLDTDGRWRNLAGYLHAAEALALRIRGTKGSLFVGVTRIRPALSQVYHVVIHPPAGTRYQKFGIYIVRDGRVVGTEVHRTEGFSATAENRQTLPWGVHPRQDLVQLTSSKRSGQWVRATWALEI